MSYGLKNIIKNVIVYKVKVTNIWRKPKFMRNISETFQAQIEQISRNIEPALKNVFLKKETCTRNPFQL